MESYYHNKRFSSFVSVHFPKQKLEKLGERSVLPKEHKEVAAAVEEEEAKSREESFLEAITALRSVV